MDSAGARSYRTFWILLAAILGIPAASVLVIYASTLRESRSFLASQEAKLEAELKWFHKNRTRPAALPPAADQLQGEFMSEIGRLGRNVPWETQEALLRWKEKGGLPEADLQKWKVVFGKVEEILHCPLTISDAELGSGLGFAFYPPTTMVAFPHHDLERYLELLLDRGDSRAWRILAVRERVSLGDRPQERLSRSLNLFAQRTQPPPLPSRDDLNLFQGLLGAEFTEEDLLRISLVFDRVFLLRYGNQKWIPDLFPEESKWWHFGTTVAIRNARLLRRLETVEEWIRGRPDPQETFRRWKKLYPWGRSLEDRYLFAWHDALETRAIRRTFLAATASLVFLGERGSTPGSLAELAPGLLPDGFMDPITGESLKYRRSAESVTVYSCGWDGDDDGGRLVDRFTEDGDLGFRFKLPALPEGK